MDKSYVFVNEYHVKPELKEAVGWMMDYAMSDLQLEAGSVSVRWYEGCSLLECMHANSMKANDEPLRAFTKDTDKSLAGMAVHQSATSEIWLDCRRSAEMVAETCAHELRHVWQYRENRFYGRCADGVLAKTDRDRREHDADQFAERAVRECKASSIPAKGAQADQIAEQDEAARRFRYAAYAAKGRGGW